MTKGTSGQLETVWRVPRPRVRSLTKAGWGPEMSQTLKNVVSRKSRFSDDDDGLICKKSLSCKRPWAFCLETQWKQRQGSGETWRCLWPPLCELTASRVEWLPGMTAIILDVTLLWWSVECWHWPSWHQCSEACQLPCWQDSGREWSDPKAPWMSYNGNWKQRKHRPFQTQY